MEELKLPSKSLVKPEELKMAMSLVNQYTEPFNIEKYKDEYAAALLKVIEERASGKKSKIRKLTVTYKNTDNLIDQLKASLARKKAS